MIMLTDPPCHFEGKVDGTLTARHTIALTTDGRGVVVLDRADVRRVLPQLALFAEYGASLEEDYI